MLFPVCSKTLTSICGKKGCKLFHAETNWGLIPLNVPKKANEDKCHSSTVFVKYASLTTKFSGSYRGALKSQFFS